MNGFDYFEKGLKQYVDFKGRASRKEFWYFILFNFLTHLCITIYAAIIESEALFAIGNLIVWFVFFLPRLAVFVRRLHDSGKSGWFALFLLFPPTWIIPFIFSLLRSEPRVNQYGPHPEDRVVYYDDDDDDDDMDEEEFLESFGDRSVPSRSRDRRY